MVCDIQNYTGVGRDSLIVALVSRSLGVGKHDPHDEGGLDGLPKADEERSC